MNMMHVLLSHVSRVVFLFSGDLDRLWYCSVASLSYDACSFVACINDCFLFLWVLG